MKQVLHAVNLPRIVLTHVFGPKHTSIHRIVVGTIIAILGTYVMEFNHLITHFIGGLLHAAGIVPHIDAAITFAAKHGCIEKLPETGE